MMKRFCLGLVVVTLLFGLVGVIQAGGVFQEDWNSGSIDPAVWEVNEDGAVTKVINAVNGVAGDDALMITGTGGWGQAIWSKDQFSRAGSGMGTYAEFVTWVEGGLGAPNQGLHGPFHQIKNGGSPDPNAKVGPFSVELGAEWNWASQRWAENGQFSAGPALSGDGGIGATFQSRFGHSSGKSNALRMRVTMGATQGGKIEWFNTDTNQWVVEGDYRDGVLGTGNQGKGTAANVLLGFESFGKNGNGTTDTATGIVRNGVFIDDIVVGNVVPEPLTASLSLLALGSLALVRRRLS